jgi:hypothetical protein
MIVIKTFVNDKMTKDFLSDFLKSISYSASSKDVYRLYAEGFPEDLIKEYSSKISFINEDPSEKSFIGKLKSFILPSDVEIVITLPADALVLAHVWDKYIRYDLTKNIPITPAEVLKRLNIFPRRGQDILNDIKVKYL